MWRLTFDGFENVFNRSFRFFDCDFGFFNSGLNPENRFLKRIRFFQELDHFLHTLIVLCPG